MWVRFGEGGDEGFGEVGLGKAKFGKVGGDPLDGGNALHAMMFLCHHECSCQVDNLTLGSFVRFR